MSKDRTKNKGDADRAEEHDSEKRAVTVESEILQEPNFYSGITAAMESALAAGIQAELAVAESTRSFQAEAAMRAESSRMPSQASAYSETYELELSDYDISEKSESSASG